MDTSLIRQRFSSLYQTRQPGGKYGDPHSRRTKRLHLEPLEQRQLLSLTPITLADAAFYGASAAGNSNNASSFSDDGQVIAFQSDAGNLTTNDFNGLTDVFVRNVSTGATTLVSASLSGIAGAGNSSNPLLSADGRYVIFESQANDLVAGDANGAIIDVFRHDLQTGTTQLVSVNLTGGSSNNSSLVQAISSNGQLVLFSSTATNLAVPSTTQSQLFVRDMVAGTTSLVTRSFDGTEGGNGQTPFRHARLSPDNRFVLFDSISSNLVSNDTNGIFSNVFVRDLQLNTTTLIDVNSAGTGSGNSQSVAPVYDPSGRFIAFSSLATDLVPGGAPARQVYIRDTFLNTTQRVSIDDTFDSDPPRQSTTTPFYVFSPNGRYLAYEGLINDNTTEIYARDLVANTTLLISANKFGPFIADGKSVRPVFSTDSQTIYFSSTATNLVEGVTSGVSQIYARDLTTATTSVVSRKADDAPGDGASTRPLVSPDGEFVIFQSLSSGLAVDDNNALEDVFLHHLASGVTTLASTRSPLLTEGYTSRTTEVNPRQPTGMSANGRYVVFASEAKDLVTLPTGGKNVFRRDLSTGLTELVSVNADGASGAVLGSGTLGSPVISADGQYVVFDSNAANVVDGQQFAPGIFGVRGIFVRDMTSGTTIAVNRNTLGQIAGNGGDRYAISPNGRYVTFATVQPLLPNDSNGHSDVYVYDIQTSTLTLVSATTGGQAGNNFSTVLSPSAVGAPQNIFSDDGRYLVFSSRATDLEAAGGAGDALYVRDLESGTTTLVSVDSGGVPQGALGESLSADGSQVLFVTQSQLLPSDSNSQFDVYVRNVLSGTTTHVSAGMLTGGFLPLFSRDGQRVVYTSSVPTIRLLQYDLGSGNTLTIHTGTDGNYFPAMSGDGQFVAFLNRDATLAPGDTNGATDLFLFDAQSQTTSLVSANLSATGTGNRGVALTRPLISASGARIVFASDAYDYVAGDVNGAQDVFAFTQPLGAGQLRGQVFTDVDASGTFTLGDGLLPLWLVFLDDGDGVYQPGEPQTFTDANGNYAFTGLETGTYHVVAQQRPGFAQSAPPAGFYDATIVIDETIDGLDFGFQEQLPNLVVDSLIVPASGRPGESIDLAWFVSNLGVLDAVGSWQDAVYLSKDATLDASDILLATNTQVGELLQGSSYLGELTATLPAMAPGDYYILVETDRRSEVDEISEADNLLVSATTINIDVYELLLEVPQADTFTTTGERHYYRISPPADRSLLVSLNSLATDGATAIYVSRNRLPSPGNFEFRAAAIAADQQLLIPDTVANSTYYVLIEGRLGEAAVSGLTLLATLPGLSITNVSPNTGGNTGSVTVRIEGSEFTPDALVEISQNFTTLAATAVDFRDPSLLFATFDLVGAALGDYDVRVNTGVDLQLAIGEFHVVPGLAAPLEFRLSSPQLMRPDRQHPVVVEVTNKGNVDLPAPLLGLRADDAYLRLTDQGGLGSDTISFLAMSPDGPAGILRPGQTSRVEFSVTSFLSGGAQVSINLEQPVNLNQAIDWNSLKASARPEFVSDEAWDVIWDRTTAALGPALGTYQQQLASAANFLSELGVRTADPGRLLQMSLALADNSLFDSIVASSLDLATRQPGLSLGIDRTITHSVSSRYRLGPLGRGWSHQAEISAATDASGNVTIEFGGRSRRFIRQNNGSFSGALGDEATLVLQAGVYRLREVHGLVQVFRPDGKLDYFEEPNGGRVEFGYDVNGRLASLSHNGGAELSLSYNAHGRLESVVSTDGQFASYAYDVSGEYLTSVTSQHGVLAYSYDLDPASPSFHALISATDFDGVVAEFSYDSQGRLSQRSLQGGLEPLTYSYGTWGEFTITDAEGASITTRLNEFAQPETITDSLGGVNEFDYDKFHHLSRTRDALGVSQFYQFTNCGSLLSAVDALGNSLQASYETNYRELAEVVDQRGNRTQFDYDAFGNMVQETRADGSSRQLVYDSGGHATEVTQRNADVIQYGYDVAGRLTSIVAPGSISQTFTYDEQGRMLSAADSGGAIELDYDPVTNLLARVDYPGGRFVEYEYDSLRRLSRINQDGFIVNYAYDAISRITDVTDVNQSLIVHYDYDVRGSITRKALGNGTYTTYAYDDLGRLASLVNLAPDESVNSRFDYTYDANSRRTSVATLDGTTFFGYDPLGQLTSVVLPSGRTIEYVYDAAGNRVRVVDNGITTNYAANNLNEYTSVGTANFTYDQNGNLETRTDAAGTTTYSYDALNQLVAVAGPGGSFSYEYDPFGNRVAETVDGVRREFLVSPTELGVVLGTYDDQGAPQANYAYGLGIVGQFDAASSYYFDFDALGSTIGLTDGFGGYVNQYSYLPFGETTIVTETVANPFRYIGEWGVRDSGDGLLHMGVRAYDPSVGQFVSDDPVSFAGEDTNLRRYVGNDPVQFIDPEGLAKNPPPVDWSDGISAEEYQKLHQTARKCVADADGVLRTEDVPWDDWINDLRSRRGDDALRNAPDYTKPKPKPPPELIGDFEPTIQTKAPPQTTGSTLRNGVGRFLGKVGGAACAVGDTLLAYELSGVVWRTMVREIEISNISIMLSSWDPNDIVGPAGPNETLHFIKSDQTFSYTIRFENDPQLASAPAQEVFVTTQLDVDLDWSTFELGDVGFGSAVIDVPAGLQSYQTRINYQNQDGSRLLVDFIASLDIATGVVEWTFRSIDPETGSLPNGVFDGFLPVNDASGRGEGFLYYLVRPRADLVSGDAINAQASIVFDTNPPVLTNTYVNTIDIGVPASSVEHLPVIVEATTFPVAWSGIDDADGKPGSGIASFDIFVSDNGGPFSLWLDDTTDSGADYSGQNGHTYSFYSVATDLLGHTEPAPMSPDATTQIQVQSSNRPPVLDPIADQQVDETQLLSFTVLARDLDAGQSLTFSLGPGAPAEASIDPVTGEFTWTPSDSLLEAIQVTIIVTDNGPGTLSASETIDITVENVAPHAAVAGPTDAVRGQSRRFTLSAQDDSPVDQAAGFNYEIDWNGDGTIDQFVAGPAGLELDHVFAEAGTNQVRVRATDKDGDTSNETTATVVVSPYALQTNESGQLDLVWGGRTGNDAVFFIPTLRPDTILVFTMMLDGQVVNQRHSVSGVTGRIVAYGQGGNDTLIAELVQNRTVQFFGDDGNDVLVGGFRADTLEGGDGDDILLSGTWTQDQGDVLRGGRGRDLLVGHWGGDTFDGGEGDDLLIAGRLNFPDLPSAVMALHAEWTSERDYATRIANLTGSGNGPRANGNTFLQPGITVLDDGAVDTLIGGDDLDCFLVNPLEDETDTDLDEELLFL
jgi:RHS repeat-associated protein